MDTAFPENCLAVILNILNVRPFDLFGFWKLILKNRKEMICAQRVMEEYQFQGFLY